MPPFTPTATYIPTLVGERRQLGVEPINFGSERDLRDKVTHHNLATPTKARLVSGQARYDGTQIEPFPLVWKVEATGGPDRDDDRHPHHPEARQRDGMGRNDARAAR